MRRFVPIALLLGLIVAVAGLSAKDTQPKYKTAEVKHLTKADDVDLSQDYLNYAYDHLREELQKTKLFGAVVEDGGTVADGLQQRAHHHIQWTHGNHHLPPQRSYRSSTPDAEDRMAGPC